MADPIQISMYINSLGLSGKEAEAKRIELEKLSDAELTKLISGKSFADNFTYNSQLFDFTKEENGWGLSLQKEQSSTETQPAKKKKYTPYERTQLRNFAAEYLYDSANNAYAEIKKYNSGVGLISTDAIVNGFKILTGQEDRHALQERLGKELNEIEQLNSALRQPGAWESKFERTRGVLYNPENIEKLKNKSDEYLEITAWHDKYQTLNSGIKEIKDILRQEQEYKQTMKNVRGPAAASIRPPKVSSHEKFGQILLEFCDGNKELVNEYMSQLTSKMGSRAEIEKNFVKILDELQQNCKKDYEKHLNGKTYEQYTKEYENAYSKALGGKDPEKETQSYITKAKTAAAYTEMGIIIASSLLLPGSSTVAKGTAALAKQVGTKAAGQIVKGTMTFTMAAAPAGLTALSAATSEDGFTDEKKAEMLDKVKSGLLYGGFGAYVSGPMGNVIENLIKTKPLALSTAVSRVISSGKVTNAVAKTTGVAAETSADVLFDQLTSDMSIRESLETNGGMNFAMMLAGGRIAKMQQALQGIKVEQSTNGNFKIKDETGKLLLSANDENTLAAFVLGKALSSDKPNKSISEQTINEDNNIQINLINKPDEGIPQVKNTKDVQTVNPEQELQSQLQLAQIDRLRKTNKTEKLSLKINDQEKDFTIFVGYRVLDGSRMLTDDKKLYKLSAPKAENVCKNELFAGDLYELIDVYKRTREIAQTENGTALFSEVVSGVSADVSKVAAKTYGLDALLGNPFVQLNSLRNSPDTPVISNTSINASSSIPFELVTVFAPNSKNAAALHKVSRLELIDSLQKVVDIPDEKISELALQRNIDKPDKMVALLNKRKKFIAEFLQNMKNTEQEGLPINEYVKKIYDTTFADNRYSEIKEKVNTSLTDYIHEKYNTPKKDLVKYIALLNQKELVEHVQNELKNENISLNELEEFNNEIFKFGVFVRETPENQKQIFDTLVDLKRNSNIDMSTGYALILNLGQNGAVRSIINTNVLDLVMEVNEKFDNPSNLPWRFYSYIIKDGKIDNSVLDISTDLYNQGIKPKNIEQILSVVQNKDGAISADRLNIINDMLKEGKSPEDVQTYFNAVNTPSGIDTKMVEYVDKLKAIGLDNNVIDKLFTNIRVNSSPTEKVQRTFVLDLITKMSSNPANPKEVIEAARELRIFKESIGDYIEKVVSKNEKVNLTNFTEIMKSLHPTNVFDGNGFNFAVKMLENGVSPDNFDKLIKSSIVYANPQKGITPEMAAAKTDDLRKLASELLTDNGYTTNDVVNLYRYLSEDDFAVNLIKNNKNELSKQSLTSLLAFTDIHPDVEMPASVVKEQKEKIADFMLELYKNENYQPSDVGRITAATINSKRNRLGLSYVAGIDTVAFDFAKKCVSAGYPAIDIVSMVSKCRIWNNSLGLNPEQLIAETKKGTDFAEKLLFENGFTPQKAAVLIDAAAFKTNRTVQQTPLTYSFDDKAIKLINDFIENKSITQETQGNVRALVNNIKLLDYDPAAVDLAKDLLKNPLTLSNGKSYNIDVNSLAEFLVAGRDFETKKFSVERFNEYAQRYILKNDYGFTLQDIANIEGLSLKDVTTASLRMSTSSKVNLLNKLSYAPKEALDFIENKIITPELSENPNVKKEDLNNVEQITEKLLSDINLSSLSVKTSQLQRQQFLNNFISNRGRDSSTGLNNIEAKIAEFDYTKYGESGLPVKYSRTDFTASINDILKDLSPDERTKVLEFHNLDLENNVFNSLPRVRQVENVEVNFTDAQAADLFKQVDSLLEGLNENNSQLYKENNIDTIIEKCRQIASIDEVRFENIVADGDNLDVNRLKEIKEKAFKFAELAYNRNTNNIPVPLSVKTLTSEIEKYEKFTPAMLEASKRIENEYNKFVYRNEFQTDDKELNDILNGIMRGMPDLMFTIGKKQHKTHKYTLDVHTMEVLKKAINDEDYKTLSDKDRTILKYSILLHDFGKKYINSDTPDTGHEIDSAEIANGILAQFKLPQQVKDRIVGIIKNHDWFAKFNKNEWDANKVSALFRSPDDYKIAKIMAKADLSSINDDFHFKVLGIKQDFSMENFKNAFDKKIINLDANYKKLYSATNLVYNTKILNKDKIPYNEKYGVRMLNLTDDTIPSDKDLGDYGLNGSTKNNMRMSVHMVADDNLYGNMESAKLGMEQTVNDNNVWSISLLKMNRTRTYMNRKYGFLTDVPVSNIAIASPNNLSSGYEKSVDKFVELLYSDTPQKNFLRTKFITSLSESGLQFSKDDYQELTEMIYNKKFLSQIEQQESITVNGKEIPTELLSKAIFDSMDSLFGGRTHSEIVAINPKIQGLVVRMSNPDDISPEFINFAKKYNLPILLIGDK